MLNPFWLGLRPRLSNACPATIRGPRAIKNAVSELGEAVKSLPPYLYARHPEVDWRGLAGLRDIVVHRYFALDLPRLWPVLKGEFPVILAVVRTELERSG